MRRKLFTAALLFVAYCLVVVLYSFAADHGVIAKSTQEFGLTSTAVALHQTADHVSSSLTSTRSFIDPFPDPPFPRPKPPQS